MEPNAELVLHWLDLLIVVSVLGALTGVAFYQWRRHKPRDLNDFFLAGKQVRWLAIGVSLMAALNSGADYLMLPSSGTKNSLHPGKK